MLPLETGVCSTEPTEKLTNDGFTLDRASAVSAQRQLLRPRGA